MTGHEEKVTINGITRAPMFFHLREHTDWTTYVNLIPDGLDPNHDNVGWYWGVKCAN